MTDEQWIHIVEALVARASRERMPLKDLMAILRLNGYPRNNTKDIQCASLAALAKKLIKDPQVEHLVQLTLERRALRSLIDRLAGDLPPSVSGPLTAERWNRVYEREKILIQEIDALHKAAQFKVALLDYVGRTLAQMECAEEVELPRFELEFPLE